MNNICCLIDHPFDLVLFLGLKNLLKKEIKNVNIVALVTDHSYFSKCDDCEIYFKEFDEIKKVIKPRFGKSILHNLLASFSLVNAIKELNKIKDIQYISANRSELTTQILLKYGKNKLIRILQRRSANINSETFFEDYKIDLKMQVLRNFYEITLGLPLSRSYVNKKGRHIKYFNYKKENTDGDLFLTNINSEVNAGEVHFPYYFTKTIKNPKKVYFFGSRFLGWDFVEPNNAIETINSLLRKIESIHPASTEFIYKPHPLESNESSCLLLNRFKVSKTKNSAEIDYIKYCQSIIAVYSIGSTASKTALNFGIDSYVAYPLFNLNEKVKKVFDDLFRNCPNNFFIKDIKDIKNIQDIEKYNFKSTRYPDIVNLMVAIK